MLGRKPKGTPKKKWNTHPEGKPCFVKGCGREGQFYCKDNCMKWICYTHAYYSSIREIMLCYNCYQKDLIKMRELLSD